MRKLYKSKEDKMLFGVCGGIGEYLRVDPTLIRIVWAGLTLITYLLPGIVFYFLCNFIIPER